MYCTSILFHFCGNNQISFMKSLLIMITIYKCKNRLTNIWVKVSKMNHTNKVFQLFVIDTNYSRTFYLQSISIIWDSCPEVIDKQDCGKTTPYWIKDNLLRKPWMFFVPSISTKLQGYAFYHKKLINGLYYACVKVLRIMIRRVNNYHPSK